MAKPQKKMKAEREIKYTSAKEVVKKAEEGFVPTAYKVPDGMKRFRFRKEGIYRLNIIPYVTGENNPHAEPGFVHYERTYFAHRNVGPNNDTYACSFKNFGSRCPICEQAAALRRRGENEKAKLLDPKDRQLFLVQDLDKPDDGLMLLETGYWKSFGELLANKIKAGDEEDNYENFFHLDDGMTLKVTCEQDSFDGRTFYAPKNIEMRPRKTPLDSTMLDDAPCLDSLIIEMDYAKLKDIFLGAKGEDTDDDADDEDDDDAPPPKKAAKAPAKKAKPVEEEDDDEEEEEEEEVELEAEDEEDEEEEEAPPAKKGKKAATPAPAKKGKAKVEEEEEEFEGDEEDEDDDFEFEEEESDDEEEESEDEEEEEEDEEEEAVAISAGMTVSFKKDGKTVTGKVTLANQKHKSALVKIPGTPSPVGVGFNKLTVVDETEPEETEEDDDFEFEEEEEEAPKKKAAAKKPAGKKK